MATDETKRLWWCKDVMIIPVVVGAFDIVSWKYEKWLKKYKYFCSATPKGLPPRKRRDPTKGARYLKKMWRSC